uniref:Suppression of tumorigenicity 7 n=1 Tax=Gasterosteus aculeatus aculeatus TaxID=481459 RepID=A0AAQ4QW84_GASAC
MYYGTLSMFLNTLTPKFYVALTGTSSLISGLILIFEWWYFRKYGTSFIEQVSVSHLRPLLGGVDSSTPNTSNGEANDSNRQSVSECKVWRNPLNLFRGAEYNRYTWVTGREPLTYYDMNLSAQDHQTFFTCDSDHLRPTDAIMQKAWRERNPQARISAAHEALELEDCATAFILLAEEEATTIMKTERLFKQALKAGDGCYRRSQQLQHHGAQYEAQHSEWCACVLLPLQLLVTFGFVESKEKKFFFLFHHLSVTTCVNITKAAESFVMSHEHNRVDLFWPFSSFILVV